MNDIPEDVLQASLMVWIDALRDGTPDAAKIIARAILAERERCAGVAESEADDWLSGPDGLGWQAEASACLQVATAIRSKAQ